MHRIEQVIVVGKGIVGLSVAEFLSRTANVHVRVVSSPESPEASLAAAANLATKAQVFGRDPHFEMKIVGKKIYRSWLENLRGECGELHPEDLSQLFVEGIGRDVFFDELRCSEQWARILQPIEDIRTRGLPEQPVRRAHAHAIEYGGESWVDAQRLLRYLVTVCTQRGVQFSQADMKNPSEFLKTTGPVDHLILCTGAETPRILAFWGEGAEPTALGLKKRRWSFGGTLEIQLGAENLLGDVALLEIIPGHGPIEKLTFSGAAGRLYGSSLSVKCAEQAGECAPEAPDKALLQGQKEQMSEIVRETFGLLLENVPHRYRWGNRLGFGHSELMVESCRIPSLLQPWIRGAFVIAAGAHKSGFLFAPCLGNTVLQKMHATVSSD